MTRWVKVVGLSFLPIMLTGVVFAADLKGPSYSCMFKLNSEPTPIRWQGIPKELELPQVACDNFTSRFFGDDVAGSCYSCKVEKEEVVIMAPQSWRCIQKGIKSRGEGKPPREKIFTREVTTVTVHTPTMASTKFWHWWEGATGPKSEGWVADGNLDCTKK